MLSSMGRTGHVQRLECAMERIASCVMVADRDRTITYVNAALRSFFEQKQDAIKDDLPHFDLETLVGSKIDIFHKNPAHQERLVDAMREPFETMIQVGGAKFDLRAQPLMGVNGKRLGTMVEWKDAANRLAREDYRAQIEAVGRSQAVISFLPDGTILDANSVFCDATGYRLDEIIGQHHRMFMGAADQLSDDYRRFWARLADGHSQMGAYKRVRKDGSELWLQASYTPLLDSSGAVYKIVKFASDVTKEVGERERREQAQDDIADEFGHISEAISTANHQAGTVADASDTASQNVQSMAAGLEEFLASVNEISRQVVEASTISQQAEREAQNSTQIVTSLAEAAGEIENVVKLISDIAEQTNLLALNATIEAARAGDAGKGFAVVASEVKSLATQTSKATEEIGERIGRVQASTTDAVQAMQVISDTVVKINEITITISSAVEEQSATTGEMSSSMQVAADGVRAINDGVREIAHATEMVDQSAQKVQDATQALR